MVKESSASCFLVCFPFYWTTVCRTSYWMHHALTRQNICSSWGGMSWFCSFLFSGTGQSFWFFNVLWSYWQSTYLAHTHIYHYFSISGDTINIVSQIMFRHFRLPWIWNSIIWGYKRNLWVHPWFGSSKTYTPFLSVLLFRYRRV